MGGIDPAPTFQSHPMKEPDAPQTRLRLKHRLRRKRLYDEGRCCDVEPIRVVFADARCALQARLTEAAFRLSSASM